MRPTHLPLLLMAFALGCGQPPPPAGTTPGEPTASPAKPTASAPSPATRPRPTTPTGMKPRKLYEIGLYATADLPADAELETSPPTIVFGKERLELTTADGTVAEGMAKAKKDGKRVLDATGYVTSHGAELYSLTRYFEFGKTTRKCDLSMRAGEAELRLLDAVLKTIRQLPEDVAAEKAADAARAKLVNDNSVGLHDVGDGDILSRSGDAPTDAELAVLKDIGYVRLMGLNSGGSITPAGLKGALGPNVRHLDLSDDWVTDDMAAALTGNTHLRELSISSKLLTDDGVKRLTGLDKLRELKLFTSAVSDAGVAAAAPGWKGVQKLVLYSPKLTAAVGPALAGMPGLRYLSLTSAAVTDDIAPHLAKMPGGLRELDLNGTAVTDAILPHLAKLPELVRVDLAQTKVTAEGVKKFKELKPALRVRSSFDK